MAIYLVSYDLRKERSAEDYIRLYDALRSTGVFCWPLQSVWIIETSSSPSGIIAALLSSGAVDDNDGLLVVEMTGRANWRRVRSQEVADWLSASLQRA